MDNPPILEDRRKTIRIVKHPTLAASSAGAALQSAIVPPRSPDPSYWAPSGGKQFVGGSEEFIVNAIG